MLDVAVLFVTHAPLVRNWLRGHTDNRFSDEDVADLTMTTFERAVRAAPSYQDRGYAPTTWLITIARHLLLDELKRRRVRPFEVALDDALTHASPPPDAPLVDVEPLMWMLTPHQRQVLACRFGRDLDIDQTMALLGITRNGVKDTQQRALRRLRKLLEAA